MEEEFEIAKLIAALLTGHITEKERESLEAWKSKTSDNQKLFDKLFSRESLIREGRLRNNFDRNIAWKKIKSQGLAKRKVSFTRFLGYAATLILLVGVGTWLFTGHDSERVLPLVETTEAGSGVQLKLADGRVVDLGKKRGAVLTVNGKVTANNNDNSLSYQAEHFEKGQEVMYNEVIVPKGCEYKLQLSDGTVVFLNSISRVRYPVVFGGQRKIELEGEAYVEVAKDRERPFIVATRYMDITVLGTKFNVSSYEDDATIKTTLVEGSVRVTTADNQISLVLKPEEQLTYDKAAQRADIHQVDVSYALAWKDDFFRFRDIRLEELMKIVMRWYDVEVVYEDPEVKDYLFGCNFNRLESIEPLMRIFENNGKIQVDKEGNVLKIRKGR